MTRKEKSRWRNAILKQAIPARFLRLSACFLAPLSLLALISLAAGAYLAAHVQGDYQQGITITIMFIHVPLAWAAMLCYTLMFLAAIIALVWRQPLADIALKAAAPLGATFTALALITGSLWGKPTWGTFWSWDGRLVSMLILLLFYLGIIIASRAFENERSAAFVAAIITLVGFINIPIIRFSVEWWHSLHQKSSFTRAGSAIHSSYLAPLGTMALALLLIFVLFQLMAMRNEIVRRQIITAQYKAARQTRKG